MSADNYKRPYLGLLGFICDTGIAVPIHFTAKEIANPTHTVGSISVFYASLTGGDLADVYRELTKGLLDDTHMDGEVLLYATPQDLSEDIRFAFWKIETAGAPQVTMHPDYWLKALDFIVKGSELILTHNKAYIGDKRSVKCRIHDLIRWLKYTVEGWRDSQYKSDYLAQIDKLEELFNLAH